MRILLVNTSELTGGAAIAAHRLMDALNNKGVETHMLVSRKESDHKMVVALKNPRFHRANFLMERIKIWVANRLSRRNLFAVDIASNGTDITQLKAFEEADIIHLHWVNQGMLSLNNIEKILQSGKPIVWTMHDMWQFTGICHLTYDCERYQTECCKCPQLCHPGDTDLSNKVFKKKQKLFSNHNVHFVAVSTKLQEKARGSKLLAQQPVSVIPNVFPATGFCTLDKGQSRTALQLPTHKTILAFGAARIDDPCKGFDYLKKAIDILIAQGIFKPEQLHLALFGKIKHPEALNDLPISYTYLGYLKDKQQLSRLYSAADAAVIPSRYETFGQIVMEAQACGCLPVTFTGSGQMDIINHMQTGYLARYLDAEDFAAGIKWATSTQADSAAIRDNINQKYSEDVVAQQYIDLYTSLLADNT